MKKILEKSKRIILRFTENKDIDFVIKTESNPHNAPFIVPWTKQQHKDAFLNKDILHLIVDDKLTNKSVGYVILAGLKNPNHSIEFMRIVITKKKKGYGQETIGLIKKIAFEKFKAHRLWLDVKVKNHIAQRLYESQGFIKEGVLRECLLSNNKYDSLVIMSLLKNK
ncbi:GNAT family N-acetyltransferase [Candidatus Roizmanbacteria bacterium CG_4_9_14_3_um_filter_33_18]|uniref:GNAT family N-acetyltransferase n=2 Tax=Candidatus Roizmaniibacteriota TaxID=1752723 RepID=A0A2M7XX45_9BACT|nr:MAG: GNAT family N-acetyltransferase [Candidatus Roizmanbacteria bacterium CG22_combo_CG10-13_8_21_14_all_34_12]PJA55304.1 MAG: GNAT family N-acetyltransferase [Candidatus Roizmanbacteria bacterium CG_4_9_14_3_um_filter_33_18]